MSEHEKHTEFLRRCLHYDESDARRKLEEEIVQIQSDERCVWRAASLMAVLTALAMAGLGYGVILADNFPYNTPESIVNLIFAVGLGSLISLVAFVGLGMVYRMKLDQRRDECRHLVMGLLESHLGKPAIKPSKQLRANPFGEGDGQNVRSVNEGNGSTPQVESAAGG